MILSLFVHVLGVVVWVGGMFFAYMALRPAAASLLQPQERLSLWAGVFDRFFPWVWLAVVLILLSGLHMLALLGGLSAPPYALAMLALGTVMMLIFGRVFFAPYRRLWRAVAAQDWQAGSAALAEIRRLIGINLSLGLIIIAIVYLGRLMA